MKALAALLLATSVAHAAPPVPALSEVTRLTVRQHQGGPALPRCSGVEWEVTFDLKARTWTSAICEGPGTKASTKRRLSSGKLVRADLDALSIQLGKMTSQLADTCGDDGGILALDIVRRDGVVLKFVDENWGCVKPPPILAHGMQALAKLALPIAMR